MSAWLSELKAGDWFQFAHKYEFCELCRREFKIKPIFQLVAIAETQRGKIAIYDDWTDEELGATHAIELIHNDARVIRKDIQARGEYEQGTFEVDL